MITFTHSGNFRNTENFFQRAIHNISYRRILNEYGKRGVTALAAHTPIDSGITSDSWGYEIKVTRNSLSITWTNSSANEGIPIAILVQYGHGTRSGTHIKGRDFINPAIKPIFENIVKEIWAEVTK